MRVTVRLLQIAAAEVFDVPVREIMGRSRKRHIVRARQAVVYLAKELTPLSYPEIARRNGGRDHSTAIHSYHQCVNIMSRDADYAREVRTVRLLALLRRNGGFPELPPEPVVIEPEPEPVVDAADVMTFFKPGELIPEYLIDTLGDDDWLSLRVASAYSKEVA